MKKGILNKAVEVIPIVLALVLVIAGSAGLIRAFKKTPVAAEMLPSGQRLLLTDCGYDTGGKLISSDGVVLYNGGLELDYDTEATNNIIGKVVADCYDDTNFRYLMSAYRDEIIGTLEYSAWKGVYSTSESKGVVVTLDYGLQNSITNLLKEKSIIGTVTMMDTKSGALRVLSSTPTEDYINRSITTTSPGSNMKVVLTYVALKQDIPLEDLQLTCTGQYNLSDGNTVQCHCASGHGTINAAEALSYSCNSYWAQVAEMLDMRRAAKDLTALGFNVNGSGSEYGVGKLDVEAPSLTLTGGQTFSDIWALLGQASCEVSPIWMCEFAANIVNSGNGPRARIIEDDPVEYNDSDAEIYQSLYFIWHTYCSGDSYGIAECQIAKTGTSEISSYGDTQKTLLLVDEDLNMAIYISIENYDSVLITPLELVPEILTIARENAV